MKKDALLALEDGSLFYGESVGLPGECVGEVVFNTSCTGYQEILTDPSYTEQIIVFTTPHIGNVGINQEDMESDKIYASGMVARSASSFTSNWRAEKDLTSMLMEQGKICISGVDTRALTHILRKKGSQNGVIMAGDIDEEYAILKARNFPSLKNRDLVNTFLPRQSNYISRIELNNRHVVVIDYGVKNSILNQLSSLGCNVTIVRHTITFEDLLDLAPDGILLSNGPGDPTACDRTLGTIEKILENELPVFGICFGHQLLSLASGAKVTKMKFGHHGANHPILDVETEKVHISSQNHGFVVSDENLPKCLSVTHRSLFDGSIAGIQRVDKPAFGFQGHPEAGPGPHDLSFLFHNFLEMMEESKCQNDLILNLS